MVSSLKPKFVCDQMLGKLSKWLRLMGYDTLYFNSIDDSSLIRIACEEGSVLFTRDSALMRRRKIKSGEVQAVFIESDILDEQLKEVIEKFGLKKKTPSALCSLCSVSLVEIPKNMAKGKVPLYVFETQEKFSRCPACGRFYWSGTHWEKINLKLKKIFKN